MCRRPTVIALCVCLCAATLVAQVKPPLTENLAADLDARIAQGLSYLARQQQPDGSFQNADKVDEKTFRYSGPKVALTSLCLIAYLSAGRMPDTGKHGLAVRNAITFLVKSCPDDGYFGKVDGSRMYGHAITTLALAEACGMEADAPQRKLVRAALAKAVRVLLQAQNTKKEDPHRGGWRYEIASGDSDLSVTAWCILALRAALNAGVDVPRESADRAAAFVLKCYKPEQKGFAYQPGGEAAVTMTAAALLDLQLLDRATRPEVAVAAKYVVDHPVADDAEYPYYARYYTTQAAFQLGGDPWAKVWERNQQKLLATQQKDGAWPKSRTANEPGQTYATAMSVMTLSIPLRLLPTYQR